MKLRAPYTGGSALGAHRFWVKNSRPSVWKISEDFLEMVHAMRARISKMAVPPRSVAPRNKRSPACLRPRRSATFRLIRQPLRLTRSPADLGNVLEYLGAQICRQRRVVDRRRKLLAFVEQVREKTSDQLGLRWVGLLRVGDDPRLRGDGVRLLTIGPADEEREIVVDRRALCCGRRRLERRLDEL